MPSDRISRWMDGYISAWNSNDPDEIGALSSDDFTEWWMERPTADVAESPAP